jgi:internalin A
MTDQAKRASHSWRRFLRFSVRGLIVLVLVIGVWLGWVVRSARIQREAVAAIEKSGGAVSYEWDQGAGIHRSRGKSWAPTWLVELIGIDYFGRVRVVLLFDATDAAIVPVTRLTGMRRLYLGGSSLCDERLAHLRGSTDLSDLLIAGHTKVTDAGLAHVKGLINLRRLVLDGTDVTDDGLVRLNGLTNLRVLKLSYARITDAGLVHLKGLTKLTKLDLRGTRVTDAGVEELRQALPGLTILR